MAPAAGVSEALTAALCRVALASAPCQAACVVNGCLGGGGRARGSRQKPPSGSSKCLAMYLLSVRSSRLNFYSYLYFWLTSNNFYLLYAWYVPPLRLFLLPAKTSFYGPPPSPAHTYTSSPLRPSLPLCGLGAYGLAGQEIREMCQPVVLNKHIFHFSFSSLFL